MKWEDFARPSVAVDVAVLTVVPGREPWLGLLVHKRAGDAYKDRWDIPGGFVQAGETLADAVLRLLREKSDVRGLQPTQLHVFDDPHRDERGWVMSVAHMDAVPYERLMAAMTHRDDVRIVPIHESDGRIRVQTPGKHRRLPWDHDEIVTLAVHRLRERYAERPDPDGLVVGEAPPVAGWVGEIGSQAAPSEGGWQQAPAASAPAPSAAPMRAGAESGPAAQALDDASFEMEAGPAFTLSELRRVHEAVAGHPLQRDNFRRAVEPHLRRTARTSEGRVGRPGVLYTRSEQ